MRACTVAPFSSQQGAMQRQQQCVRVPPSAAAACRRRAPAAPQCSQQPQQAVQGAVQPSRRALLALPAGLAAAAGLGALGAAAPRPAAAFVIPPPGFRYHEDKLDGYSFFYPEDWQPVTTSGNDVFFRNPFNVEENCFVNVSSPSSSKYESVADLGSPEAAAKKTEAQYLEEFMSTRLGVRRTAEVVRAAQRTAADGRSYYDIQTRVTSYASRNQLAVSQAEIESGMELEWDRRYLATLGVAGKRLYEFRLQTSNAVYEKDPQRLLTIMESFVCREVAA